MDTNSLPDPTSGRHFGMDWLRIAAFALLILYHVGMAFVPWGWHVQWNEISEFSRLPMLALNGWRLALLFVVSGYATAALLARSERLAFLRSRSARLLIPTVFAIIVVIPPQVWIDLMYNHGYAQPFAAFWRTDYFRFGTLEGIVMPTWQHLWFVVYLFAYTLVVLALHALLPAQARRWIVKLLGKVFASAGGLLMIPVLWAVLRPLFFFPGVEDTHALLDDFAAHYIFLAAFLFGFLLRHSAPLWSAIRATWQLAGLVALAATAAMLGQVWWLTGQEWSDEAAAIYAVVRAVQSWCTILALLGIADRFWNRDARCRTMLNEAVFPFYIIHQTIIVMFIWYLRPVAMPAMAAFLLTVAITAIGCWLFYRIGRAVPGLRLLIGLRGWRIPPSTAPMDAAFRRV
ncbi:acyltransferase family protein [Qipengyuania sp. Mu-71]|jgi:hypothetical protein|uniref:acyltransferase family protein n=1 Tax=Qipengyuania sp. Mu-71 TaxID=3121477 RepID=UPI002FE43B4D